MPDRILFVDDNPELLSVYQRSLSQQFSIETAVGGVEGLNAVRSNAPFAVIVSDMTMPGMNGIQFLSQVKELSPDSVRIMLTGNANLSTAMKAVNEGSIFRFLTKPCSPDNLDSILIAGVAQHRLITAERELLEQTLNGCVKVLTEVLAVVDPLAFARAQAVRLLACDFGRSQMMPSIWELELGAMLAPLGYVTIPPHVVAKERAGQVLLGIERDMVSRVPEIGSKLIAHIQRLEAVSRVVLYQDKHFDGNGFPFDAVKGEQIPYASRVIKILKALVMHEASGMVRLHALSELATKSGWYDPDILEMLTRFLTAPVVAEEPKAICVCKTAFELRPGMLLLSNIETSNGKLLIAAGYRITEALYERIQNYARLTGIKDPIEVQLENPVVTRTIIASKPDDVRPAISKVIGTGSKS